MYLRPISQPLLPHVLNRPAVYPLDGRALPFALALLLAMPALLSGLSPAPVAASPSGPRFMSGPEPVSTDNVTVLSVEYPRYLDPYDYSDVLVLINNNSAMSRQVGEYFAEARGIISAHVVYLDVPAREVINKDQYEDLEDQVKTYMLRNNLISSINYIVTTKGLPLKIWNSSNWYRACVDEELALIYGPNEGNIGNLAWVSSPYYQDRTYFSRNTQGIYLVNRLTGYDWDDVKGIIDRANDTYGVRGKFVLDVDPTKGYSTGGYGVGNLWLRTARDILVPRGEDVFFDETRWYVTGQTDVMGYASWGSNDANDTDHAKPHNTWVDGSIAETFVSTGGRTFTYPPSYGQSMVADIIAENVTGVKGYVYEPYLSAIAHPDILFERYTAGFNLAESYRMASQYLGWMGVVVGDPKCSPYRDVPDLATSDDLLTPANATPASGAATSITVQVKNIGGKVEDANLTLLIDGKPWLVTNLTFDTFSLTTLRISFDAPTTPGIHAIKVLLNDPLGFFETLYDNNEAVGHIDVQERPVVTLAVSNASPMTLDSIRFEMTVLASPREISLFFFDFDDGSTPMVLQTNSTFHAFEDDGVYSATAWVMDTGNVMSYPAKVTVTVGNRAPLPLITVEPETRLTGEAFTFSANNSSDLDGQVESLEWDLDDGNTSDSWTVFHSYRWPGEYVVRLTVTDDDGTSASVTRRVTVLNRAPGAAFFVEGDEVWKGRTTILNASTSSDVDGVIAQYEWDFGDGTEGEVTRTPLVHHVFERAGPLVVILVVVDDLGSSDRLETTVEVLHQMPVAALRLTPESLSTGEPLSMDGSESYDPDGSINLYEFIIRDDAGETVVHLTGTDDLLSWSFEDDGEYSVELRVTDEDGGKATVGATVLVLNRPPSVVLDAPTGDLYGSVVEVPATLTVGVLADDEDGQVTSIVWLDCVDGKTLAEGPTAAIPMDVERALEVLVMVVDDDDDTAITWLNLTLNEPPDARFNITLDGADGFRRVHVGDIVTFDASNSSDPGGIARFQWDFGDGTTQEGLLASHAYIVDGTFVVTLKVTDDHGATDEFSQAVSVVEEPSPESSGITGTMVAIIVLLVVAMLAAIAYLLWRRRGEEDVEGGEGV